MAEKYQQQAQGYPLAPASIVPRSDEEHGNNYQSEEQIKKKKRMKCFAYIAAFAVFQTIIILVFALTVMRVKSPKVRLGDVTVTNYGNGNIRFTARVLVKNTNFGRYKFDSSIATIRTGTNVVGQFVIPDSRARARSTKKIYVIADLTNVSGTDTALTVETALRGKVELMKVIKRKKSGEMSCTMNVNLSTNAVQDLRCK
ncbi:hypothetical protein Salat_1838500 [Sesamum alatum]|uniref:Late embryogenesis abundant protein LEA-2 subgroup domain-containing protein n=1 Tax=Sesamum alatum TaxID=300844 RepID=A0AAE1Y2H6_9LAMI|nr:hypothetical protein Salat_1838500 [Sesamum alatum]